MGACFNGHYQEVREYIEFFVAMIVFVVWFPSSFFFFQLGSFFLFCFPSQLLTVEIT